MRNAGGRKRRIRRHNRINHDHSQTNAIFPHEIFCEILARLPVEAILRCKSVCKSWNGMIQGSYFIKLQWNMMKNKSSQLILQPHSGEGQDEKTLLLLDTNECKVAKIPLDNMQMSSRLKQRLRYVKIKCSCNGLLCMAMDRNLDPVFVGNPVTRQCVQLPASKQESLVSGHQLGFGFDCSSNKYKIVRLYKMRTSTQFQIITLGEKLWRELNWIAPHQHVRILDRAASVFWNGSLHWLLEDYHVPILAFDLSEEKFYTISFPGVPFYGKSYDLVVSNGSLTIMGFDKHLMRAWEITGNKDEGFSLGSTYCFDTHVCWNQSLSYTVIDKFNCNSFLFQVYFEDRKYKKRSWFKQFVADPLHYSDLNIHGLPDNFCAVHFEPTFVSPLQLA